jgi:predicted AAA+ superfamily ATPase
MFFRRIEHELMQWAERAERKPMVLRGARQVGKTTVVNKFGRQFENYLYVNLEKENSKQLIESTDDVKKLLPLLFLYCNKTRKSGRILLFIDEIQESPHALKLLRYFYEDTPEILVIAAGSLLETMLKQNNPIPVGRVEYMAIHPCSFNEFLSATGDDRYVEPIINADLPVAFHEEILHNFNLYALIGGMPEVVARYAAGKDIVALSRIYNQLLTGFKNDVEKYAVSNSQSAVISYILDEGWAFSGETITLGGFAASSYKARETGEAMRILQKAMLLELVYPTTNMVMPAITDLKKSPKLFWLDSGLVNYISGIQKEYLLKKDLVDTWRGKAAEQIVAQELKALSFDTELKQKYWVRNKRGSTAEVDFVYVHDGRIIPIEVKSGHNAHLKSIHQFMNETHHDIALRIWSGRYSEDNVKTIAGKKFRLINLPFYMISALPNILRR